MDKMNWYILANYNRYFEEGKPVFPSKYKEYVKPFLELLEANDLSVEILYEVGCEPFTDIFGYGYQQSTLTDAFGIFTYAFSVEEKNGRTFDEYKREKAQIEADFLFDDGDEMKEEFFNDYYNENADNAFYETESYFMEEIFC